MCAWYDLVKIMATVGNAISPFFGSLFASVNESKFLSSQESGLAFHLRRKLTVVVLVPPVGTPHLLNFVLKSPTQLENVDFVN